MRIDWREDEEADVFVDGVSINKVVSCDPDLGWAVVVEHDDDGLMTAEHDEVKKRRIFGKIIVRFRSGRVIRKGYDGYG